LDNCTLISTLVYTWYGCTAFTSIPSGLLDNCTALSNLLYTWDGCVKAQLSPWIFYNDGAQNTRFLNKNVNFSSCFNRSSFSGTIGQAPDLWNCDFGTGTATKTNCFAGSGNSLTSLINYNNIPAAWGGTGYVDTPPEFATVDKSEIRDEDPLRITATDLEASGGALWLCDDNNLATATKIAQTIQHNDTLVVVAGVDIGSFTPGIYYLYFIDSDDQITDSGWPIEIILPVIKPFLAREHAHNSEISIGCTFAENFMNEALTEANDGAVDALATIDRVNGLVSTSEPGAVFPPFDLDDGSLVVLFNKTVAGLLYYTVDLSAGVPADGWCIWIEADGIHATHSNGSSIATECLVEGNFLDGETYALTYTVDLTGDEHILYVDSESDDQETTISGPLASGVEINVSGVAGSVFSVRIFDGVVLTEEDHNAYSA